MYKKLLMFTLIPLVLLVMVGPAMAIGPQKAEKNPNIEITPEGVELILPSGVVNEWMADTEIGVMDFIHMLDASKFKIRNALPLTIEDLKTLFIDPEAALEVENKWGYIPIDVLVKLFIWMGYPEEVVGEIASMWPEGIYVKFVNVGKYWYS